MKKLYVFDIDKTIKPTVGPIPFLTRKAISLLLEKDLVALATGRTYEESAAVAKTLGIKYLITSGGSEVYHDGQLLYRLPQDLSQELASIKQYRPWHLIYTNQGVYSSCFPSWLKIISVFRFFFSKKSSAYHFFKMFQHIQTEELPKDCYIYKIFIFSSYQGCLDYYSVLGPVRVHEFEDKAQGIQVLLKKISPVQEIITFGDGQNDVSMFLLADRAYAMKQGNAKLQNLAVKTISFQTGIYQIVKQTK